MPIIEIAQQAIERGFAQHYYIGVLVALWIFSTTEITYHPTRRPIDIGLFVLGTVITFATASFSGNYASHLFCAYAILAMLEKMIETKASGGSSLLSNFSGAEVSKIFTLSFFSLLIADVANPLPGTPGDSHLEKMARNLEFVGGAGLLDGLLLIPLAVALFLVIFRDSAQRE